MGSKNGRVTVWGSGEEARDLLYVDDLVRFVELAMDRQQTPYEMLHASAGNALAINDVVARIVRASGRDLRIEHDPEGPTIRTSFALDSRRARQVLGWEPKVSFDEGVRRTVEWWRKAFERAA
jgi:nucleoside-diphosphate-sugar epimerase